MGFVSNNYIHAPEFLFALWKICTTCPNELIIIQELRYINSLMGIMHKDNMCPC